MELFQNIFSTLAIGFSDWGAMHPIVVHFPIALFPIALIFLLRAFFSKKNYLRHLRSSAIIMFIGSIFLVLCSSSGEIAAEPLDNLSREAVSALNDHYELGHFVRNLYIALTLFLIAFLVTNRKFKISQKLKYQKAVFLIYLLFYCYGLLLLLNAGHYGGELVHDHGIRSTLFEQH